MQPRIQNAPQMPMRAKRRTKARNHCCYLWSCAGSINILRTLIVNFQIFFFILPTLRCLSNRHGGDSCRDLILLCSVGTSQLEIYSSSPIVFIRDSLVEPAYRTSNLSAHRLVYIVYPETGASTCPWSKRYASNVGSGCLPPNLFLGISRMAKYASWALPPQRP